MSSEEPASAMPMKVIRGACREVIEPHLHTQTSGWVQHPSIAKPIFVVRVDYHDPEKGILEGVSINVEAP